MLHPFCTKLFHILVLDKLNIDTKNSESWILTLCYFITVYINTL